MAKWKGTGQAWPLSMGCCVNAPLSMALVDGAPPGPRCLLSLMLGCQHEMSTLQRSMAVCRLHTCRPDLIIAIFLPCLSAVLVEVKSNVDVMTFYRKCFRSDSKNKSFSILNYTFIIMFNKINLFLYLSPQIFWFVQTRIELKFIHAMCILCFLSSPWYGSVPPSPLIFMSWEDRVSCPAELTSLWIHARSVSYPWTPVFSIKWELLIKGLIH